MNYDPFNALIIFLLAFGAIFILFWPEKGFWFRIKRAKQNDKRIMMEDTLKELYECERLSIEPNVKNLAGSLAISTDQMAQVLKRLGSLNLIKWTEPGIRLTSTGRKYSLRIIRIHRLWEQYLAERTGIPEANWHDEADKREHESSDAQMQEISKILGNPRYDPHGDPIPTENGDLPPMTGIILTDYMMYQPTVIEHIEDEPKSIYEEIVAKGIHVGMIIEKIAANNDEIKVKIEGKEQVLSKLVALNITVNETGVKDTIEKAPDNLTALKVGEAAEVLSISKACRGAQRRRLMDLGILPGTIISAELRGLGGDPTAFRIRGANIALRRDTAELINVKKLGEVQ